MCVVTVSTAAVVANMREREKNICVSPTNVTEQQLTNGESEQIRWNINQIDSTSDFVRLEKESN